MLAATDDQQRQEATAKQSYFQAQLRALESIQANSEVCFQTSGKVVGCGAKVEITDSDTGAVTAVQIVSE